MQLAWLNVIKFTNLRSARRWLRRLLSSGMWCYHQGMTVKMEATGSSWTLMTIYQVKEARFYDLSPFRGSGWPSSLQPVYVTKLFPRFAVRVAHVAPIDTSGPSSPLRGGDAVKNNRKCLLYVTIWSGTQTRLDTRAAKLGHLLHK
jgi:hypothetical protein